MPLFKLSLTGAQLQTPSHFVLSSVAFVLKQQSLVVPYETLYLSKENMYYLTHYRTNLPISGLTNPIKGKIDSIKTTKKTQFIERDRYRLKVRGWKKIHK